MLANETTTDRTQPSQQRWIFLRKLVLPVKKSLLHLHAVCFHSVCLHAVFKLVLVIAAFPTVTSSGSLQAEVDAVPDARQPRPQTVGKIAVIEFQGEITHERTRYFESRFRKAKEAGCDVLLIEIDSPGGLKTESLKMARMIRDCDWAYTVVYVGNEAISGGALMSLGADEIWISPNAKFGDIGEIGFDAEQFAWRLIEPKVESYLSRDARDLAQSKGRSPDLAESMIDKDVIVYVNEEAVEEAENQKAENLDAEKGNGQNAIDTTFDPRRAQSPLRFKLIRADDAEGPDAPQAPWQLVPESGAERFLTLSGTRARQLNIAQAFAESREEVVASFNGGTKAEITVHSHRTSDSVAYFLNYPLISGLILVVGLIALYLEFAAPGIGIGGLIAGLCATLFFWSHFTGGTAGWMEVILFVAGIVFVLAEVFVIPGFGVAGVSGLLLLLASVILAGQNFVIPESAVQWDQMLKSLLMVTVSGTLFMIAAFFITSHLGSLPLFNRMVLSNDHENSTGDSSADQGVGAFIAKGDRGIAHSTLRPSGLAKINGRVIDVISDGSYVESGTEVVVVRVSGNFVTVAEIDS